MQTLKAFNNSTSDFTLGADVIRAGSSLHLIYKISDLKNLLNLPPEFTADEQKISREDGLWNETCFEMFLRPQSKSSYYEFNFSLKPAWNEYFFDGYRQPQPPNPCYDITLKKMTWDGQNLKLELLGLDPHEKFDIGLTAVLKERTGAIHYMATKHAGQTADFHHPDSFNLRA